jgi:hypothetical protein
LRIGKSILANPAAAPPVPLSLTVRANEISRYLTAEN